MPSRPARICGRRTSTEGYCSGVVREGQPCTSCGWQGKPWAGAHGNRSHYVESTRLKPVVMQRDYGRACPHCGAGCVSPTDHVDHYPVALADGGQTTLDNLRRAHAACNVDAGASLGRSRKRSRA